MLIGLIGNPNCGKTTLFNLVTGSRNNVGNWAGVTVEVEQFRTEILGKRVDLVDLPGIYSLQTDTPEQKIAHDFLMAKKSDVLVNVIDANNLERGLFLTLQLIDLNKSVIVAINMIEEIEQRGARIDFDLLSQKLGVEVVGISARQNKGIDKLFKKVLRNKTSLGAEAKNNLQKKKDIKDETDYYDISKKIAEEVTYKRKDFINKPFERLDSILTNRYVGIPIFLLVIFLIFYITFGLLGPLASNGLKYVIDSFSIWLRSFLSGSGLIWLTSLIIDGIITGVGSILLFLPQMLLLFFFLSILEDSGYIPRVSFMLDRLFKGFGLNGKSVIPLIMGFGCTVPAIMACRTIENKRERVITTLISPFISCGAKLPVYGLLCAAFIPDYATVTIFLLYVFGIVLAFFSAFIMSKFVKRDPGELFLLEIPQIRLPHVKTVIQKIHNRLIEFLIKAGTIILIASVCIWFLKSFNSSLQFTNSSKDSLLAVVGNFISPVFRPLGFGNWQCSVSLLTGISAKEAIASTLIITAGGLDGIKNIISPIAGISFLVFILLYTPCLGTLTVMAREIKNCKVMLLSITYQMLVAWLSAFIIFNILSLF